MPRDSILTSTYHKKCPDSVVEEHSRSYQEHCETDKSVKLKEWMLVMNLVEAVVYAPLSQ